MYDSMKRCIAVGVVTTSVVALCCPHLYHGTYNEREMVGGGVNRPTGSAHPRIAPDESFIIFDSLIWGKRRVKNTRIFSSAFGIPTEIGVKRSIWATGSIHREEISARRSLPTASICSTSETGISIGWMRKSLKN